MLPFVQAWHRTSPVEGKQHFDRSRAKECWLMTRATAVPRFIVGRRLDVAVNFDPETTAAEDEPEDDTRQPCTPGLGLWPRVALRSTHKACLSMWVVLSRKKGFYVGLQQQGRLWIQSGLPGRCRQLRLKKTELKHQQQTAPEVPGSGGGKQPGLDVRMTRNRHDSRRTCMP